MIKPIMTSFDQTVTISYLKSCCETKRCFASYSKTEFLLYVAIVSSKQLMWEVKGSIRCESVCPTLFMSYCTNGGEFQKLDCWTIHLTTCLFYLVIVVIHTTGWPHWTQTGRLHWMISAMSCGTSLVASDSWNILEHYDDQWRLQIYINNGWKQQRYYGDDLRKY